MYYFPHPFEADEDGLLAIGGDLNPERLLLAYRFGIFPWYNDPPILWWHTHPRCVLFPDEIKIAKSMRSYLNQEKFKVTYNQHFDKIINSCRKTKRKGQLDTWISSEVVASYTELHHRGYAHSVEVWQDDEIVGGLYGIAIGHIFFGESMYSEVSNASKYGFIKWVELLRSKGIWLIDCQQETRHLVSLGARMISRELFWDYLKKNLLVEREQLIL